MRAPLPVERLLDEARFTPTHRKVFVLAAMGILLDGFDFFIMGVALPLIDQDWSLSALQIGMIGSAAVIGSIVGATMLGALTDKIGRQLAFRIDLGLFVVFALASALAPNVWMLIVFRFMLGVGIGADYPISSSYVAEIAPARIRSRLLVAAFSFQAIGQLLGVAVGVIVLNVSPEFGAWRWMLAFGVVPAVIIVYLRRGVPESPRWMIEQGRYEEGAEVLSQFCERPIDPDELVPEGEPPKPPRWRNLFSARMRERTVLCSVPWFLMDVATYGIGVFTPTIIAAVIITDTSEGVTNYIADDIVSAEGAAFVDIFLVTGFALAIWLVAIVGKIKLQTMGFIVMGSALLLLTTTPGTGRGDDSGLALVFIGFALFNLFMNMGPNGTTFALPAEVYPTSHRAAGAGFAAAAGKTGAALGTLMFPILEDEVGLSWTLGIIAAGCYIAAAITWTLRGAVHPQSAAPARASGP